MCLTTLLRVWDGCVEGVTVPGKPNREGRSGGHTVCYTGQRENPFVKSLSLCP